MTLSNSATNNRSDLRPNELIEHSSATSLKSSTAEKRAAFKSDLRAKIQKQISLVLFSLNATAVEPMSYAETLDYQAKTDTWHLGKFKDFIWHIPKRIDPEKLQNAIDAVTPIYTDNMGVRQALIELWLVTGHERLTDSEREKMLNLYNKKLSEYEPAAVRVVLSEMAETRTWWPSWAEIQSALGPYSNDNLRLHHALKNVQKKEIKLGS